MMRFVVHASAAGADGDDDDDACSESQPAAAGDVKICF